MTTLTTGHPSKARQLRDLNTHTQPIQEALKRTGIGSSRDASCSAKTSAHPQWARRGSTSMTHDPRLPTLEQVMNGNPFEIIDTPWGPIEAWRASTMATGTMGALAQVAAIVMNDAAELEQKAAALDAKKSAVLSTVNRLLKFMSRVDALTSRVEALEEKRKADEATQRELDEEPLELPPDFNRPQDLPPSPIGEDESFHPTGDLHSIAPKEEEELPEPPLEVEDAGGVALSYGNVPTSYVRGGPKDQAGDLPEELEQGLPEPPPEPKGSVFPQPISVSLNKA